MTRSKSESEAVFLNEYLLGAHSLSQHNLSPAVSLTFEVRNKKVLQLAALAFAMTCFGEKITSFLVLLLPTNSSSQKLNL